MSSTQPESRYNLNAKEKKRITQELQRITYYLKFNVVYSQTFKYTTELVIYGIYKNIMKLGKKPRNSTDIDKIHTMEKEIEKRRYDVEQFVTRGAKMVCLPVVYVNDNESASLVSQSMAVEPPFLLDPAVDPIPKPMSSNSFELPRLLPQSMSPSPAPYDCPRNLTLEEQNTIHKKFQKCFCIISRYGHYNPSPLRVVIERQLLPYFQFIFHLGCQKLNWSDRADIDFLLREVYKLEKIIFDYEVFGILPYELRNFISWGAKPLPDLRVLLAAVLLKADDHELTFGDLYKNLHFHVTSKPYHSLEDVYSTVFADPRKWFLTSFHSKSVLSESSSIPVALSSAKANMTKIHVSFVETICNYTQFGDKKMLQYLEEANEIAVKKLFPPLSENGQNHKERPAETSSLDKNVKTEFDADVPSPSSCPMSNSPQPGTSDSYIPSLPVSPPDSSHSHSLPNLLVGNHEYQLIPIGPAPVGHENDPGFFTFYYEKVNPASQNQ